MRELGDDLTPGEKRVLMLLCKGYSLSQIAKVQRSSRAAVWTTLWRIRRKLLVTENHQLVAWGLGGFLPPDE